MVRLVDVSFCSMEDSVVNSVTFSVIEFIFPKPSFCTVDEAAPSFLPSSYCYSFDDGSFFLVAANTAVNFMARFIFPLILSIPFMNAACCMTSKCGCQRQALSILGNS